MKKIFTFLSLCLSFFFFSCNIFSTNDIYSSIVINFGSVNNSRAVTYTIDNLSYCVVSIEPKVQDDIRVNFANGETKAVFRNLVSRTYKIKVSAFNESDTKIAYGESGRVEVKAYKTNSVKIKMEFLAPPDYSDCVVGDFILKDGTVLSKNSNPQPDTVAAVIVRAAGDGKPALGVGIFHNKDGLAWCKKYTDSSNTTKVSGFDTNITELQGTTTSGYTDGSDGWDILKEACSDAEAHPEYYPAWNYSLTYAEKNGLTGYMAEGWYFPTFAELYTIFQNMETVDASLLKAGGDQFEDGWYISSTITNDGSDEVRQFWFDSYVEQVEREGQSTRDDDDYYTCTVKAFN
ncbi:MAG: hypothetical protein MJ179_11440 [Treponema sp.]|nr:hypothetical protein [Treponema sp.]